MLVRVVFPLPKDLQFDYYVPETLGRPEPGQRVLAPLGNRRLPGFIWEISEEESRPGLKNIEKIIDEKSLITKPLFALAEWMKEKCLVSRGEALAAMIPLSVRGRPRHPQEPPKEGFETPDIADSETEKLSAQLRRGITETGLVFLKEGSLRTKMRLILDAAAETLSFGGQVILLAPEYFSAEKYFRFFAQYLGKEKVAKYFDLTDSERYSVLSNFFSGRFRIAVGTRSAVFLPLKQKGLIIVTGEGHPYYKEEQKPVYSVTEVVLKRRELGEAGVLFSSVMPSAELYSKASGNEFLFLESQAERRPVFNLIEVPEEKGIRISGALSELIRENANAGRQVILYHIYSGLYRYYACRECSWTQFCPDCGTRLLRYEEDDRLLCRKCGKYHLPLDHCPRCGHASLSLRGSGQERIEKEICALFPLLESGVLSGKKTEKEIQETVSGWKSGRISVLVGGDMIFSRISPSNMGLLALVSFDSLTYIPDFRSEELAMRLLMKMEAYAVRAAHPVTFAIQTSNPGNPVLEFFQRGSWQVFLESELEKRKNLGFPPFRRWVRITLKAKTKAAMEKSLGNLKQSLETNGLNILAVKIKEKRIRWEGDILVTAREEDLKTVCRLLGEMKGSVRYSADPQYTGIL